MQILKRTKFNDELKNIFFYIAQDSKTRAKKFKDDLVKKIEDLIFMPYKCRESIYFEDTNIRDLIFKGYVIVYKIDEKNDTIFILGIKKYTNKFL